MFLLLASLGFKQYAIYRDNPVVKGFKNNGKMKTMASKAIEAQKAWRGLIQGD